MTMADDEPIPPIEAIEAGGNVVYVVETDESGILLKAAEADGGSFPCIWTSEEDAEKYLALDPKLAVGHRVSPISYRELHPLLERMRDGGIKSVGLIQGEQVSGIGIEKFLAHVAEAVQETDRRLLHYDHFLNRLAEAREWGLKVAKEDQDIPVDCDVCGHAFILPENEYRNWRSGLTASISCPECKSSFNRGRFGRAQCKCGEKSGFMSATMAELMDLNATYRCAACTRKVVDAKFQQFAKEPQRKTGCLSSLLLLGGVVIAAAYAAASLS